MLDDIIKEPFLGFQPEALKFLKSLQNPKNNNTAWFAKHREKYDNYLREPMKHLIDTLAPEIKKIDPEIVVGYKSIFRINRDIRFSKNKHPYKTHYAASFAFDTFKYTEIPQFYFHLKPNEFLIAGGQYSSDPERLKKIRKKIFSDYENFEDITGNKKFKKAYGGVHGEKMIKLPKGYEHLKEDIEPGLLEILKMKNFYVEKYYDVDIIFDSGITDIVLDNIKLMCDFVKYLHNACK